jgi:hypothetical protein
MEVLLMAIAYQEQLDQVVGSNIDINFSTFAYFVGQTNDFEEVIEIKKSFQNKGLEMNQEVYELLFTLSENYRDAKKIINEMKRKGHTPKDIWYHTMFLKDIYESDFDKVIKDYERIHKRVPNWDSINNFTMKHYEVLERNEFREKLQKENPSFDFLIQLNRYNNDEVINDVISESPKSRGNWELEDEEGNEYFEGKEAFRLHRYIERNKKLVNDAKESFKKKYNGRLFCEVCDFNFYKVYGERGEDFIEAHHTKPVSEMKSNAATKIEDMRMLCSNCHRMVHHGPLLTVEELKELINKEKES